MILKPEQISHINIVNWFKYTYPQYEEDLHHFANERKCSPQHGAILRKMGVKAGVSDFFLALAMREYHGLWIELKTESGKLSEHQKRFLERKNKRDYYAVTCYGEEAAKEVFKWYLSGLPI